MRPPNIVFILCDDLGYGDLGCYGQKILKTPNIDKLALNGVKFTDFYSTSPVCSPARTSIMTGLHSGHLPIRALSDCYLPDEYWNLAKMFNKAGYVAECFGKYGVGCGQHHDEPLRKGFDGHYGYNCMCHAHNYYPPFLIEDGKKFFLKNRPPANDYVQWVTGVGVAEEKVQYSVDLIENAVLDFIDENVNRPFFLYYCTNLPHANNEGGNTSDGMEVDTYGDFEKENWTDNEKGFARMIQRIDQTVGKVMAKLEENNLLDDTIVIFSSDNGPHEEGGHQVKFFDSAGPFQGYKRSLHEGGIRVPFIVHSPKRIKPNRTVSNLSYFPDLLPTFTKLSGLNISHLCDGLSLVPLLEDRDKEQPKHPYLYFEFENQIAIRKDNFKFYQAQDGTQYLYDLANDIHEDNDVKMKHIEIFNELKSLISIEHIDYSPAAIPNGKMRTYN